jgi:hypothetical protein
MKIQITGTHNANEVPYSLAGSQNSRAKRRINQRNNANVGGIVAIRVWLDLAHGTKPSPTQYNSST